MHGYPVVAWPSLCDASVLLLCHSGGSCGLRLSGVIQQGNARCSNNAAPNGLREYLHVDKILIAPAIILSSMICC